METKKIPAKIIFFVSITLLMWGCSTSGRNTLSKIKSDTSFTPYDAIIVPGVPYTEVGWSNLMKARVYWSYYLIRQGLARHIIFSGSAVYTPYVEARIMAEYAKALGLPGEIIHLETEAEHSTENLYYGYRLSKKLGFADVAVATDPFQTAMLRSFSRRKNIPVGFLPMDFKVIDSIALSDPDIDPTTARVSDFVPLPDRESFFRRFRGTQGKNITELTN